MRTARPLVSVLALLFALAPGACGGKQTPSPPALPATPEPYDSSGRVRVPLEPSPGRPNVVLVVIDTLRADALSLAGPGELMPNLRKRALQGVTYLQASAPAPWTQPSMASLLTGVLPSEHGVTGADLLAMELRPRATWAEILSRSLGYETLAWVGGPWTNRPGQLLEGFEHAVPQVMLQGVGPLVERWASRRQAQRPYFLLLHTFEAHDPYGAENHPYPPLGALATSGADPVLAMGPDPSDAELTRRSILDRSFHAHLWRKPAHAALQERVIRYQWSGLAREPHPSLAQDLREAYDAGVRWVDGLLERILSDLERRGLLENTVLIVTADHGEAFGEHGQLLHGRQLYDELLRVPLVIVGPGERFAPRVDARSVSLLDLLPSCLAWLGAPLPSDLSGSPLPLPNGEAAAGRTVLAEESRSQRRTGGEPAAALWSARSTSWKAILTQRLEDGHVTEELYDLRTDPGERSNLAGPDARIRPGAFESTFAEAVERLRDQIWPPPGAPAGPPSGPNAHPAGPRPAPLR